MLLIVQKLKRLKLFYLLCAINRSKINFNIDQQERRIMNITFFKIYFCLILSACSLFLDVSNLSWEVSLPPQKTHFGYFARCDHFYNFSFANLRVLEIYFPASKCIDHRCSVGNEITWERVFRLKVAQHTHVSTCFHFLRMIFQPAHARSFEDDKGW